MKESHYVYSVIFIKFIYLSINSKTSILEQCLLNLTPIVVLQLILNNIFDIYKYNVKKKVVRKHFEQLVCF